MKIIETQGLTRQYQQQVAVDNLNLEVEAGRIFGMIGPNGAGKTTTVRMLTTLLNPSSGTALINGFDIQKQPRDVRASIGYVPQEAQADEALTGREHLILQGKLYNMERSAMERKIDEVLELVDLRNDADKRALEYSGGMRKLLDVATGLLHAPKVLFLDEPTAGIDVAHRQRLLAYIRQLPAAGVTVFLTTHFLEEVDRLADQVALVNKGKLITQGTPAQLKANIGTSIIDVAFAQHEPTVLKKAAEQLSTLPALVKVVTTEHRLKLFTQGNDDILTTVRQQLTQQNMPIMSLAVAQPTLDDVFIYHVN